MAKECTTPFNNLKGSFNVLPPKSKKAKGAGSSADPTQTDPITLKVMRKQYHNLDPIACLVGKVNKACILIDEVECLALIDSGAQISTFTIEFVKQLGLKIHQLDRILKFETTGGGDIPYMGYVEVNLQIPKIKAFNEDLLMLVTKYSAYAQWVPIQLGTLHIDKILDLISEKEITELGTKWKWSKIASLLTGKMAQVKDKSKKTFYLDKVKGTVNLTKTEEIPPFSTIQVHGVMKVKGHDKCYVWQCYVYVSLRVV